MIIFDLRFFCGGCTSNRRCRCNLTDEGSFPDYLGIKVEQASKGGTISLSQRHLISSIARDLGFTNTTKPNATPASPSAILQQDLNGPDFQEHWSYCSVLGKLNFLEESTRPDIAYAVHQCAHFSVNPKATHAAVAVQNIVCYLIGTPTKGLMLAPLIRCYLKTNWPVSALL